MKSGFVAILGRPNVGKSTLLNALVGSKISIVTDRPQTTRDAIQGVLTRPEGQIVFVDSPGIHEPRQALGRRMMREVRRATSGCHLVVLVIDAAAPFRAVDQSVVDRVRKTKIPAFLLLNKIDLLPSKRQLLPEIDRYRRLHGFEEFVPVSARKKDNLELLVRLLFDRLPEAHPYYPEDFITDQPERFLAAELIREQTILATQQEVPHSLAVLTDSWEESPGLLRLIATVYVEREGQKGILIGSRGGKLKRIATSARRELELRFGRKVFLEMFVKVRPKWRDQTRFVSQTDFRHLLGRSGPGDQGTGDTTTL